ncbi:MAG: response regulator [Holophagaceae bacterium]|nr:response regulator [Holophagaceae bacterium]
MGQRLLIVDSDRAFLKEQQVSLEAAFETEVASSPDGVIGKLESGAYAAVLICVEVSDNKGYALCTAIRKNPGLADVKVALISAKATEEEYRRHQSLKGKADLYLQKPIAPSALVASLNPFVPMRSVDPDNPLGDLADSDLGEDWLDGLKSDIVSEVERPTVPEPPTSQTMAIPMAMIQAQMAAPTSQDNASLAMSQGRVAALEAQVSGLESTVEFKDAELRRLQAEFDQLRHSHDSVTQNMEDLERRQAEAETLKQRLADTEAALKKLEETPKEENADSLKTQLRGAMGERTELLLQVEALNNQMAEKTTRIMTLMKEKDHLQQQSLDDQTKLEAMAAVEAERDDFKGKLETHASRIQELESALNEGLAAKAKELELLSSTHAELESKHKTTLEAFAEAESKLKVALSELPALEVTVRGQGRELVELGNRVAAKDKEIESLNAKVSALDADVQASRDELKAKEAALASLETAKQEIQTGFEQAQAAWGTKSAEIEAQVGKLQEQAQQKDDKIEALKATVASVQQVQETLERDKQVLQGQLAERQERLQSLATMLAEAADKMRKGADLAQG